MKQGALPMAGLPPQVLLEDQHYLGRSHRASLVYEDEFGVMVFAAPTARHLPTDWLELVRWCLIDEVIGSAKWNGPIGPSDHHRPRNYCGSRQWKAAQSWLREQSDASTVVSYSDPSVGHTGALYRACNWLWAPTWHRIAPPPTGNGRWTANRSQSVKDRWIAILTPDQRRERVLSVKYEKVARELPWVQYREPKWKRGHPILSTGGGDYKRWLQVRPS
jgi:hypothetical protein